MNKTKKSFLMSLTSLLLCVSMLMGTTFAWFTDSVSSNDNVITAGNLDAEMYWSKTLLDKDSADWKTAKDTAIFTDDVIWEPGHTQVRYVKVENAGSLNFKWKLSIEANGTVTDLAKVIDVYYVDSPAAQITSLDGLTSAGKLNSVLDNNTGVSGNLIPGQSAIYAIAFHMDKLAGNDYQKKSLCDGGFSLKLIAAQDIGESDSFGDDYDKEATWPENTVIGNTATATVVLDGEGKLLSDTSLISADGKIKATIPAGTKLQPGLTSTTLNVANMSTSGANITLNSTENSLSLDVHVLGVAEDNTGVIAVELLGALPASLNIGNYRLYHVEDGNTVEMTLLADGQTPADNTFAYNPATGDVTLYMDSFSEVALVADTVNAWEGNFDYSWYNASATELAIANADQLAAFGAIVGGMVGQTQDSFAGKTVKLLADINLGDKESENKTNIIFYPIGYYNSEGTYERTNTAITSGLRNFEGTFDGNGHTVANFYQNTWEMKGDHNWYTPEEQYYRDGMGLFGRVYGGTVKNLTVKNFSSDGEIATTGVIAAYAEGATFENIAIFDCNPRVYNIGNGGIVGCVGWYAKEEGLKTTFTNITVDNSNKISALWGSYDVACGGIVGQYYPTSGQSAYDYPQNSGIDFVNCHVSAVMDVYNDVCANYQYYAYRYTGMMIGSVRENETIDGHVYPKMDGITAENCTVHFGDWNDYYYCELVANSLASYTHDHQMSRLTQVEKINTETKKYLPLGEEDKAENWLDIPTSGRVNYVVVKAKDDKGMWIHGDGHDYAECYHFVNGVQHFHDVADADNPNPTETVNGVEGVLKEDKQLIYREFNQLFTGYGWGVTSKGLTDFNGITNMDIKHTENEASVEKFESSVTELSNNREYKLSEIFSFVDNGVELVPGALTVGVTNLDESGNVVAEFNRNVNNWKDGTITLTGKGKVTITIQDYYFCTPTTIEVTVKDRESEEKFDVVMNNGDFLHRVGNVGTVALDKLFKAKDGVTVGTVSVTVEALNGTSVSGTYSNNAIQFNGTGVVKVTIKDDDSYCTPTELYLEVVDAYNATGAQSTYVEKEGVVTFANNVVLLNDVSGGFDVSNGYAVYGNGFTVTCSGKGSVLNTNGMAAGYINVTSGGILDNVQVICDIYPVAYLYSGEVKVNSNIDTSYNIEGKTYYMYQLSAVAISGDSTISNSYIYGARNNIYVGAGNVNIENTVTECGSVSNIHIKSTDVYTVTLDNVTTIQYLTTSKYDPSKKVMGFGVLIGDNESESNAKIVLEGDLRQYNWVKSSDTDISNSYAKTAISEALKVEAYQHTINNTTTVNMGIAVLNNQTFTYEDNRTNKDDLPYALNDITMLTYSGQVYSLTSGANINENNRFNPSNDGVTPYIPTTNGIIAPSISHSGANGSSLTINTEYNNGWITTFTADLDNISGGSYAFKFSDLVVTKNGVSLAFTVKDSNGNNVDKNTTITLNQLMSYSYTLVVTDNQIYGADGTLTGNSVTHEMAFVLYATKTSIDPPKFTGIGSGEDGSIRLVGSKGGEWRPAYPALQGVFVTYWSASESQVKTVDLSTLTNLGTMSGQTWTYTCDDYTLRITGGRVHSTDTSYVLSPYVANGVLYFAGSKTHGTGTSARLICLEYVFTDKNASTTVGQATEYKNEIATVQYADLPEYSWSSFQNGTLEEPSSGIDTCVTPDTLVTLADGTQVRVDSLTGNEELLVWNMETGKFDYAPIMFVDSEAEAEFEVIKLCFSDGTEVKVISEHGFWDYDLNKYVYLDRYADKYIGHTFAKQNGGSLEKVTLTDVVIETEVTTAWSPVTVGHLCYFVNGMLSMPGGVGGLFNIFEVDAETMTYDHEAIEKDIETYGLFTYEELNAICPLSEEMFNAAGGAYLKISIGKGNLTMDELINMINRYSVYFN